MNSISKRFLKVNSLLSASRRAFMFRVAQPKVAATKSSSMFRRILPIAGFAATSFYMMTDIKSRYAAGAFRSFATADEKY